MTLNRRQFIGHSLAGAATLAAWSQGWSLPKPSSALRLTLIHTNDVHSHLDPFTGGEFDGLGGAEQRVALIRRIRAQRKHVMLLDAGDIFQGTPYFNIFEGEAELKAMSAAEYDAATIGNHEFDAGIERLAEVIRLYAKFPFLCSNYEFRGTPMEGLTRDYMVVEKEGLRIGLFGLGIRLQGLVFPGYFGDTKYLDPIAQADRVSKVLRHDEHCDFIICLSHINLFARSRPGSEPGDRDVISEVPEVDVVLGGHNHIRLETPNVLYRQTAPGYVAQAGWAGTHLGVLEFDIFARDRRELAAAGPVPVSAGAFSV